MSVNLLNNFKNIFSQSNKPKQSDKISTIKQTNIDINEDDINPHEKKLKYLYQGCFINDPEKNTMETYLANVQNQLECIKLGKDNNFKYVGLQNGNQCYASNNIDFANIGQVDKNKCNIPCDEINTGFCGGLYLNQVYHTDIMVDKNQPLNQTSKQILDSNLSQPFKSTKLLEQFINNNNELENINKKLAQNDMVCAIPLEKYSLMLSLLIIIILIYLIMEYLSKIKD